MAAMAVSVAQWSEMKVETDLGENIKEQNVNEYLNFKKLVTKILYLLSYDFAEGFVNQV